MKTQRVTNHPDSYTEQIAAAFQARRDADKMLPTPSLCDICNGHEDVKLIEERYTWGQAAANCLNKGFTGRKIPWCARCRKRRGRHSFRYSPVSLEG